MSPWRRRANLVVATAALLLGWLSPQYATKLWGPALSSFLQGCPLSAGLIPQSFWVLLLVPPKAPRCGRELCAQTGRAPCRVGVPAGLAMGLPLGVLVALVHVAWYSSFAGTNVATNTLLWNTDTVTTPLVALAFTRQRPRAAVLLGGLLGLAGAGLAAGAVGEGDTALGCGLCFAASLGYAVNAVLVEHFRDPVTVSVVRLLGLEGLTAAAGLLIAAGGAAALVPGLVGDTLELLPPAPWLLFLGLNCMLLNVGWLWCTELVGASWTAMVACSSIPLAMGLDLLLLGREPQAGGVAGSVLVLLGVAIVSFEPKAAEHADPAAMADTEQAAPPEHQQAPLEEAPLCPRWAPWGRLGAVPLLAAVQQPLGPGSPGGSGEKEQPATPHSTASTASPSDALPGASSPDLEA